MITLCIGSVVACPARRFFFSVPSPFSRLKNPCDFYQWLEVEPCLWNVVGGFPHLCGLRGHSGAQRIFTLNYDSKLTHLSLNFAEIFITKVQFFYSVVSSGLEICSSVFRANRSLFSESHICSFAICLNHERITHVALLSWATRAIRSRPSFFLSDLIYLSKSLKVAL